MPALLELAAGGADLDAPTTHTTQLIDRTGRVDPNTMETFTEADFAVGREVMRATDEAVEAPAQDGARAGSRPARTVWWHQLEKGHGGKDSEVSDGEDLLGLQFSCQFFQRLVDDLWVDLCLAEQPRID